MLRSCLNVLKWRLACPRNTNLCSLERRAVTISHSCPTLSLHTQPSGTPTLFWKLV